MSSNIALLSLGLISLSAVAEVAASGDWSYDGKKGAAPANWSHVAAACGLHAQSPVDISTTIAHRRSAASTNATNGKTVYGNPWQSIDLLQFNDVAQKNLTVKNNGHALQVDMPNTGFPTVTGGVLPSTFNLAQLHFHWGTNSAVGSEHTFDGKHFPLEMHLVHWNSDFGKIGTAFDMPRGLGVVGVFFKIGAENPELEKILSQVGAGKVLTKDSSSTVSSLDISKLLPAKAAARRTSWTSMDFYSYTGSLTTPPCYQSVLWHLVKATATVSEAQMAKFRSLKPGYGAGNQTIGNNFRPVQPLDGRTVKLFTGKGSSYGGEVTGHWGYHGQATWKNAFPACGLNSQSPIDIASHARRKSTPVPPSSAGRAKSSTDTSLDSLSFSSLAQKNLTVTNNGHALQVNLPPTGFPSVTGGSLDTRYNLAQLHFHWGTTSSVGSEHKVDGKQFPLEMHLVHYNSAFGTIGTAVNMPQGLAVVGVLFKIGATNKELDNILAQIGAGKVLTAGSTGTVSSLDISKLMPSSRTFYSYTGSLTTPPCYQSVLWHMMKTTVTVSETQMAKFRSLLSGGAGSDVIGNNFRSVQAINGRSVKCFDEDATSDKEAFVVVLVLMIIFAVCALAGCAGFIYMCCRKKEDVVLGKGGATAVVGGAGKAKPQADFEVGV